MSLFKPLKNPITKYDDEGKVIEPSVHPENKQYLLLIFFKGSEDDKTFEIITGRTGVYTHIRENIDSIDILKSHVLVDAEKVQLSDAITVYKFMKLMEDHFEDEDFSIDDYVDTDDSNDTNSDEYESNIQNLVDTTSIGNTDSEEI